MNTFSYAIIWILIIEIFSFASYPLISIFLSDISDRGFAVSKILGILLSSYVVWIIGSIHLLPFTQLETILVSLIVIVLINIFSFLLLKPKVNTNHEFKFVNKLIIIEEIIFILSFAIWVYIRGLSPVIMGTEKFMDFGIMNAILKSAYFPPHDMWLSGFSLNYYYYGQYIFSFLTKLSGVPSQYAYNFTIPTIFAVSFTLVVSLVTTLTKKILPAILSASILTLAGNLQFISLIVSTILSHKKSAQLSFWYPSSTRLIPYTINEYPIYSFIVSDLHAHVIDIMVVLSSLIVFLNIFNRKKFNLFDMILSAFLLGIAAITNSWDVLIYITILFLVLLYTYDLKNPIKNISIGRIGNNIQNIGKKSLSSFMEMPFIKAIIDLLLTGILAIFMFLPFYLFFKSPTDGIGFNNIAHSNPSIELILFGFFFFFILSFILFIAYSIVTKKAEHQSDLFISILIGIGLLLLIFPEFFYLKDIFYKANPPYFRANTVFKLYYESWILFSISVGYIISRISSIFRLKDIKVHSKIIVMIWNIVAILFLIGVFSYTYESLDEGYFNISLKSPYVSSQSCVFSICFNPFKGDDGTEYINEQYPEDYQMINYLNNKANSSAVIAEAVGDSYTYFARISANTGLQAVLGWPNHEYQWRNTYAYSSQREQDIFNLYDASSLRNLTDIIRRYNITYIVIGGQERNKYPDMNESLLLKAGKVVFRSGNSLIIKTNV